MVAKGSTTHPDRDCSSGSFTCVFPPPGDKRSFLRPCWDDFLTHFSGFLGSMRQCWQTMSPGNVMHRYFLLRQDSHALRKTISCQLLRQRGYCNKAVDGFGGSQRQRRNQRPGQRWAGAASRRRRRAAVNIGVCHKGGRRLATVATLFP